MRTSLLLCIVSFFYACSDSPEVEPRNMNPDDYASTYALIQGEIWDQNCTSCHSAGTSFARQSNLVLTSDVSYEQLINRPPNNKSALADGLLLVGDQGIESLHKSFLWEKINAPNQDHFYSDHPEYGALMPLGGEFLTNGELELIRQWIISGAPEDRKVADVSLLNDSSRYEPTPFEPLPTPESGFQLHVEPFEILPQHDREIFVYRELKNEEPVFINKVEISMAPGSHHFILYNFKESLSPDLLPQPDITSGTFTTPMATSLTARWSRCSFTSLYREHNGQKVPTGFPKALPYAYPHIPDLT